MGWVFHRHTCKYGHLWRSIFLAFGYESWYKWELFGIVTIDWNLSSSHAHWHRQGIYVRSYIVAEAAHTWLPKGVGYYWHCAVGIKVNFWRAEVDGADWLYYLADSSESHCGNLFTFFLKYPYQLDMKTSAKYWKHFFVVFQDIINLLWQILNKQAL